VSPWREATLGEACELYQPQTISSSELVADGSYPVYGANGIIGRYNKFNHAESQLLVTCRGATCGAINISQPFAWINGNAMVVRPRDDTIELNFLAHLFRGGLDLSAVITGAAQPQITRQSLAPVRIRLPVLVEQRRIAAILDQAETLRTQRRAALAQLDSLTQSIFLDMFGDPGDIRKRWREEPVGELTDCIVPGRDKPKSFSGNIPWITTVNLVHRGTTFPLKDSIGLTQSEIDEVRAKVIPSGSVIISCVGDLGVVSIAGVPMVINQQLHSFQCGARMNNIFLMYSLSFQKAFMLAKASSTTLPYMNKSVCNSVPVLVPPVDLQQAFADRIQAIEALRTSHQAALSELDALFASLQQRAFAGEL
jgi:type I restriction enzyme, S subunit